MIKIIYLTAFILSVFLQNVFCINNTLIKGKVIDKETGSLISNATVKLFGVNNIFEILISKETKTDLKGNFKFNIESTFNKTDFFVIVKKEKYISSIPDYYFSYIQIKHRPEVFKMFKLKKNKNLKIYLTKGGGIHLSVFVNNKNVKQKLKLGIFTLSKNITKKKKYFEPEIHEMKILEDEIEDGNINIYGLENSNKYKIIFNSLEIGEIFINNISVKKSQVTKIDYVVDCITKASISGLIKVNTDKVFHAKIYLYKKETTKESYRPYSMVKADKKGFFKNSCLMDGDYKIKIVVDNYGEIKIKIIYLKLKKNEQKELNMTF